jgi:hypothetical protein
MTDLDPPYGKAPTAQLAQTVADKVQTSKDIGDMSMDISQMVNSTQVRGGGGGDWVQGGAAGGTAGKPGGPSLRPLVTAR